MQLMVEGDKWEMYIPSELAYGDGGSGAKIPGGSVLVFIMEIQEINGEKVPALTCEVVTGEGCNEKETAYLAKMKEKSSEDQKKQLDRLNGMVGQKMTADLQDWIRRRIYILALLTKIEEQEL